MKIKNEVVDVSVEKPPIHIVVSPLGTGIGVLKPPIARWHPQIIYAFTSMPEKVNEVNKHLEHSWKEFCGPNGPPTLKTVEIKKPYRVETIQEMMSAFDEVYHEVKNEYSAYQINWHIGIAGGTNLMPVAMALSASTYSLPVFYTLPAERYPELVNTPRELVLEIPVFEQLGPAVQMFKKMPAKREVFKVIDGFEQFISVKDIAYEWKKGTQAVYQHLRDMLDNGVIEKNVNGYRTTTLGKLALSRSEQN